MHIGRRGRASGAGGGEVHGDRCLLAFERIVGSRGARMCRFGSSVCGRTSEIGGDERHFSQGQRNGSGERSCSVKRNWSRKVSSCSLSRIARDSQGFYYPRATRLFNPVKNPYHIK